MANHGLSITDGTTTIELNSGNQKVLQYNPKSDLGVLEESLTVLFSDPTDIATARNNIQTLNRLLVQAELYSRYGVGKEVYIYFNPGEVDVTDYRARLLSGKSELVENPAEWRKIWDKKNIPVMITWERDGKEGWEGPETALTLTNQNGSSSTGLGITNHSDATSGHDNTVKIASAELDGDLPSPAIIEMENTENSLNDQNQVFIFHNVYSDPNNFAHILEAEDGSGGTPTVDAGSSGGYYNAITWAVTTETELWREDISTAIMEDASGGHFAVVVGLANGQNSDLYLKVKLAITVPWTIIWEGTWVSCGDQYQVMNLGIIRLPPHLVGLSNVASISLSIFGMRDNASNTLDLDFVQLSPISMPNGYRRLESFWAGVTYQQTLVDNMNDKFLYHIDTSGNKSPTYTGFGGPVMLVPNEDNMLYFLSHDDGGEYDTSQTWDIVIKYRPRRRVL